MRTNPGLERHGMRHQSADATVAIDERMDVVQTMMRGRDGHDARRRAERRKAIALLEVVHEV